MKIEHKIIAKVLAKACVRIVLGRLNDANEARQTLRLKNFSIEVYQEFVNNFSKKQLEGQVNDIVLKVPHDADISCDDVYRIPQNSTITSARNDKNLRKLVYLETEEGSDSQSTKDFFTIRDSDLLQFAREADSGRIVVPHLVEISLEQAGLQSPATELLIDSLESILETFTTEKIEISTPKFVAFVYSCSLELGRLRTAMDIISIKKLIGRNLIHIEFFNDDFWFEKETTIGSRFKANQLYSELAKSETVEMDVEREQQNAKNTTFTDIDGEEFPEEEQKFWRDLCVKYLANQTFRIRERIPYFIFDQIFTKKSKGVLLGDLVLQEIGIADSGREDEYVSSGLNEGLNTNIHAAAASFLELEHEEKLPLKDIITPKTRKRVERLATPKADSFFNPLIQIARFLTSLEYDAKNTNLDLQLKISLNENPQSQAPTLGVFNLLFSRLLTELSEYSSDVNTIVKLALSEHLSEQVEFPAEHQDDGEGEWSLKWEPLVLKFELLEKDKYGVFKVVRSEFFSWLPDQETKEYLFLWWGLIITTRFREQINYLEFPHDIDLESFRDSFMSGQRTPCEVLGERISAGDKCPLQLELFKEERNNFLSDVAENGLHFDSLSNYVENSVGIAKIIRNECIPNDSWENDTYQLLASDAITTSDSSSMFVLPSNIIKARWIAGYLRKSYELAEKSIQLEIPLNEENGDLYFTWLETLSSSQQPATSIDPRGNLYESHSDKGWGEYMIPVQTLSQTEFSTESPEGIVEEVCVKVKDYLHHHPHKCDGLTLTVISKRDASFSSRLVSLLRKGEFSSLKITLNLITQKSNYISAMSHFDDIDVDNRFAADGALFPPVELRLFAYSDDPQEMKAHMSSLETDVAIIPQLLEGGDDYQSRVRPEDEAATSGNYDPLFDSPIFIQDSGGERITVSLKPEKNDDLIDTWSTLVTRQKDSGPVSVDGSGCDYYVKKIGFKKHAELFVILHESSHWVVTFERYLKREQLEKLNNKPEIISFKDQLGPGGNYSLIISSNSGRKFILSRLTKKLSSILSESGKRTSNSLDDIALGVYDSAREITPELALDALGVARVSEEILGLSIARKVVDEIDNSNPIHGYSAWISLDEYTNWFTAGESSTRADMAKITFDTSGPMLKVGVFILESKLRKDPSVVEHAVQQVKATLRLFEKFLDSEYRNSKLDAQLWRDKLLNAVRNSGDRAIHQFGKHIDNRTSFDLDVGDAFRNGAYELSWLTGITVQSTTSGDVAGLAEQERSDQRIWRVKVGVSGIVASFDGGTPLPDQESEKITRYLNEIGGRDDLNSKTQKAPENVTFAPLNIASGRIPSPPNDTPTEAKEIHPKTQGSSKELQDRYQQILTILSQKLQLPIRAVDSSRNSVVEGPSSFLFKLKYEGSNPREVEAKRDALKLYLGLEEDQSINFSIGGGFINVDVPKNEDERYFVVSEDLWENYTPAQDSLAVPLGIDRFGERVIVNFSNSDSPHLLIGGTTGSGKSEVLHTLLSGMYRFYDNKQIELLLVDPKGTEMEMYQNTKFVNEPIAMFEEEAMYLLEKAVDEMQFRFLAFRELTRVNGFRIPDLAKYNEVSDKKLPWLVLVIDEYADITSDKQFKKTFEDKVKRIAQKGRSAGIHLIIATQKPSAEVISTSLRSNLPAQIALRVKGYNESKVIIEESGAEGLIGKGDSIFKSQSSTRRVQCGKVQNLNQVLGIGNAD